MGKIISNKMGIFNSDNQMQTKLEDLNKAINQFIESKTNQNWNKITNRNKAILIVAISFTSSTL